MEGALRSPARTVRFRHNDMEHFERCLENCPPDEKIFIVSEGVFSMEGDVADLPGILKLAKPYGARTFVDEAHGIGVLGETGAGAAEHLGVLDDVDIVMGTFSKSLASVGGFIAGEKAVVDYLKHTARPFVEVQAAPRREICRDFLGLIVSAGHFDDLRTIQAEFAHFLSERRMIDGRSIQRRKMSNPVDLPRFILLRLGSERPQESPNRQPTDECAAVQHWMISSARTKSDWGIVRPRALAVLRLITRSNFVGCSTGKSPG